MVLVLLRLLLLLAGFWVAQGPLLALPLPRLGLMLRVLSLRLLRGLVAV